MTTVARLFQVLAAVLAVVVARKRYDYRPIALFLVLLAIADFARLSVWSFLAAAPVPYTGTTRLLFHVDQALFVGATAGFAAVAAQVFLRRGILPIALGYFLIVAILSFGYPTIRGERLAWAYTGIQAIAVLVSCVCATLWFRRRTMPQIEQRAGFALVAFNAAIFAVPYIVPGDPFGQWASMATLIWLALYVTLVILQGRQLWSRPPPSLPLSSRSSLH